MLPVIVDESYASKYCYYYYMAAAVVAAVTFVVDVDLDDFVLCSIGTSGARNHLLLASYTIFQKCRNLVLC
jgi:hypothetical protein